jgi:hypothetical protein
VTVEKLARDFEERVGKDNQAISGSSTGANSSVLLAGRDLNLTMHSQGADPPKSEKEELIDWFKTNGFREPLSHVLSQLIRLSQIVGNTEVEHWARMELFGYNEEGAMAQQDVVPKYRTVVGQYMDEYNRNLRMPQGLEELNGYRNRSP